MLCNFSGSKYQFVKDNVKSLTHIPIGSVETSAIVFPLTGVKMVVKTRPRTKCVKMDRKIKMMNRQDPGIKNKQTMPSLFHRHLLHQCKKNHRVSCGFVNEVSKINEFASSVQRCCDACRETLTSILCCVYTCTCIWLRIIQNCYEVFKSIRIKILPMNDNHKIFVQHYFEVTRCFNDVYKICP